MKKRLIYNQLKSRLEEQRHLIQVLLGPRQVGKTTFALQVAKSISLPCHYVSADLATLQDLAWLQQQWETARQKGGILIIDEVQKIPHWAEVIKSLWDDDTRQKRDLKVMLLGSSPWLMQQGLSESLAGRFELTPISHWSFKEMNMHFNWSLERYLYFGGYPGAVHLVDEKDPTRWINYINDSLIETTLSRDILLMTQVNKPALLRRLFQLDCAYSGQILSYTKMLGQLQEAGNTTTLAHYLDLLSGAGLITGIQKYSPASHRQKSSSPKLNILNTALMTALSAKSYKEAHQDHVFWDRLIESAVGAHLLNTIRGTQIELFYWREKDQEIDFVLRYGSDLIAIEVKSNQETLKHSGMALFAKKFSPKCLLLVGDQGLPLADFLQMSPKVFF